MFLDELRKHATEAAPDEACGLVVARGKKVRIIRARNLAEEPQKHFDLDTDAWLEVQAHEEVIGIYHSHPHGSAKPSEADLSACEASGLPWHIVGSGGDYQLVNPSGYRAPYARRPYVYGVHDCYSLARDWFLWECGIALPDYRRHQDRKQNRFLERYEESGFARLVDAPAQRGDLMLVQVDSPVPNHCAVYLGDGTVLHHVEGRLSTRDPWGGYWVKHCCTHLRHNSLSGNNNG